MTPCRPTLAPRALARTAALPPLRPLLSSSHLFAVAPPHPPPSPFPGCSPATRTFPTTATLPPQTSPPDSTHTPAPQNSSPAAGCLRGALATAATLSTLHSTGKTDPAETSPPSL